MKKRVLLPGAAVSVFSCLIAYFAAIDSGVYAQRDRFVGSSLKPAGSVTKTASTAAASAFGRAASQNAQLRSSLQWVFGGKTQTGWNIYIPLIAHTIETESGPDTPEFALAVSRWQNRAGVPATGVLDKGTLETFTRYWQSRRLGRSGMTAADTLQAAPIVEFFDSTRSPDLLHLERETYAAYKKMIAAAAKELGNELRFTRTGELAPEEKFLKIVSAYRSPAYQEALRKREPGAGRAALAKNSPHSTGHALDIYVGGEPVKTLDSNRLVQVQSPAYKWLVKNAHRFGFYPYFYEPWHWEYVPKK